MKKLNKVAMLIASAALATAAGAQSVDNWRAADGTVWKNGTLSLCVRSLNPTAVIVPFLCIGILPHRAGASHDDESTLRQGNAAITLVDVCPKPWKPMFGNFLKH